MYKNLLRIAVYTILFFSSILLSAQEDNRVTLELESATLEQIFSELEKGTAYSFFFLHEWLSDEQRSINFENIAISEVMEELLSDTNLNFFIYDKENRIILTQGAVIYDELPSAFYSHDSTENKIQEISQIQENIYSPVFLDDATQKKRLEHGVATIGKADGSIPKQEYILEGTAVKVSTNEAIPDLVIRQKGTSNFTTTDEDGKYRILLPSGYNILQISALGIDNVERELIIYNNGKLKLELQESLEQLDEVVVEADALKNVEDTTTGAEEIDLEDSKNIPLVLGERDILQIAKTLPGISSAGEGATGLNVRGGKTDQNLVLLDNGVVYNPTHFFGIFQALNPFTTSGVNIYKGFIPIEYGGRLSSVFDIKTKEGNTTDFGAEASIGPVTSNVAFEIPLKKEKSSLIVGGRGAYANWILRSLEEESLNNSEATFYDAIIKYHDKLNEKNNLNVVGYYSNDAFSITSDSLYNYQNRLFSVQWDNVVNENKSRSLYLGNSDYGFGVDFDANGNRDFTLSYKINETNLNFIERRYLNDKHSLTYGLGTKYYQVRPGEREPLGGESSVSAIRIADEMALEGALFVGDEIKAGKNLVLEAGARYAFFAALGNATQLEYAEGQPRTPSTVVDTLQFDSGEIIKTYGGPEIRLAARYSFTPSLSIKASLQNSFQFIHTLSNNTTVSPIDTWKLSDLNIGPQRAYQASLGLYKNLGGNEYEFSLEGYYKRLDNVLDFKTGANLFLNENVETEVLQGDGKAFGVELLAKKNVGRLNGWFSYTFSRSLNRFESAFAEEEINNGEFFPSNFDKPHDISLIANYRLTRRYSFSANFVYQTGRPVTYPIGTFMFNNAEYVLYSERNVFRIPDYYRLDLGINIEGNHKIKKLAHSFWTISVYNVLGRNNPYSYFFITENGEVRALKSSIFAIPVPSITYNLKF